MWKRNVFELIFYHIKACHSKFNFMQKGATLTSLLPYPMGSLVTDPPLPYASIYQTLAHPCLRNIGSTIAAVKNSNRQSCKNNMFFKIIVLIQIFPNKLLIASRKCENTSVDTCIPQGRSWIEFFRLSKTYFHQKLDQVVSPMNAILICNNVLIKWFVWGIKASVVAHLFTKLTTRNVLQLYGKY